MLLGMICELVSDVECATCNILDTHKNALALTPALKSK